MKNPKLVVVSTRITQPFAKILEEYMLRNAHASPADLLRDALREKIKNDTPDLYQKLYAPRNKGEAQRETAIQTVSKGEHSP